MDLQDTILTVNGVPPDMLPLAVTRDAFETIISAKSSIYPDASLTLHLWHHQGVIVWHWECLFARDSILQFQQPVPLAGIVASLQNTVVYSLNKRRHGTLGEGQYNMFFNTPSCYEASFAGNRRYASSGIHFSLEFLRGWVDEFGWLEGFIHKASFQKAVPLCRKPLIMPPQIKSVINDLKRCPYTGTLRALYMETKSKEFVLLAFHAVMNTFVRSSKTVLTSTDSERIREAIEFLQRRPWMKVTYATLTRETGLNEAKLKAGFQRLYLTSPHAFHLDDRLQKACDLLQETDLEVGEIGELVGFRNQSNFSAAFKKIVGVVPKEARNKEQGHRSRD